MEIKGIVESDEIIKEETQLTEEELESLDIEDKKYLDMDIDEKLVILDEKEKEFSEREKSFKKREIRLKKRKERLNEKEEELEKREEEIENELEKEKNKCSKLKKELKEENDKEKEKIENELKEKEKKSIDEIVKLKQEIERLRSIEFDYGLLKTENDSNNKEIESLKEREQSLKQKNKDLSEKLSDCNSIEINKEKLENIRELEEELERLKLQNKNLRDNLLEVERYKNEIETLKSMNDILKSQKKQMESDLVYLRKVEQSKGTGIDSTQNVFKEIIDRQTEEDREGKSIGYYGDEKFVDNFVRFCEDCGFKYSSKLVRSFLCSLKSSKLTILKGYSGTGKTSLPILFAKYLRAECVVIPVQPNWRTKQDIMGFYNYFTNKFIPTELTQTLLRANVSKDRIFLVVLDEMNLARVEYYFSEFNSKLWLDKEKREIELFDGISTYDSDVEEYIKDNKIKIPDNIFFIGTINEDDSVSPISDKIFDRAQVVEFIETPTSENKGDLEKADEILNDNKDYTKYNSFIYNTKFENNIKMGIVDAVNKEMDKSFGKVIGYRSIAQIETFINNFINSGGEEYDAMDMQLVSKFTPKIKYLYSPEDAINLAVINETIKENFEKEYKISETKVNDLSIISRIEKITKELDN